MFLFIFIQVNGGIQEQLKKEVLEYDYHKSFFDIFVSTGLYNTLYFWNISLLFQKRFQENVLDQMGLADKKLWESVIYCNANTCVHNSSKQDLLCKIHCILML